jgi:hypothetical protein
MTLTILAGPVAVTAPEQTTDSQCGRLSITSACTGINGQMDPADIVARPSGEKAAFSSVLVACTA